MISCGMDGLLHIIYDNTMTSGHFICVHMYMKSPRDNMLALYMRDVVTMVSKNFSLLRIRRSVTGGIALREKERDDRRGNEIRKNALF